MSATGSITFTGGGVGDHVSVRSVGNQGISASSISLSGGTGATSANNYASIYQSGTSGTQTVTVNGGGTLAIQGGSSSGNAYAFVSANGTAQTIAFPAGGTINIQGGNTGTGNSAGIYAANGSQSITGAPAIYLTGGPSGGASDAGNFALIGAELGAQNIAAGTIELYGGDAGVSNFARLYSGGNQTIGATGVTLWGGPDGGAPGAGNFAQIRSDASQALSVGSGGLYLIGGSGSQTTASDNFASIYQAGTSGTQAINVAAGSAIYVLGGDGIATNVDTFNNHGTWAYIRADGTSQAISFAGPGGMIHVVGGDNGSGNYAGINARNGSQTITGSPDIHLLGGATGGVAGEGNWAQLYASAGTQEITANSIALAGGDGYENFARLSAGTQQNITAADLSLAGGVSSAGTTNYAVVHSPIQVISTTGDVTLTGGASAATVTSGGGSRIGGFGGSTPSATSVTMTVGGDLHLVGGSATDSGSAIGSGIAGGQTTDVTLNVSGNVTLDPGTVVSGGSRLGSPASSVAAGAIAVTAGGNITMNGTASGIGTAIRTSGNVSLAANSINQTTYSTILANQLTTTTAAGASLLGGGNAVAAFGASNTASGAIALLNASPTLTLGSPSQVAGAPVNVTQTGDLVLPTMTHANGTISATGTASIPSGVTVTATGGTLSAGTLDVQSGGTLNGTGTVTANVSNSGTVAPGSSAGKLTVSGNYTQTSGGKLTVEIGGTTAGTDYDQLAVTGAATLGGTLNVVEGALAAVPGTTYSVITCGSCTGTFATVNSPTINATPTYGATSFTLPFTSFLNAWNGGVAADWNDPVNWSRGSVPTANDDVVIDVPSTVATITVSTGTQSARSIVTSENLTLSGGSLNLAAPSTVNGEFTLSGGTLAGSGNLTLNGGFNWSAGTISNTGVLTTTGTSTIAGGGSRSLSGAWANSGAATIDATDLNAIGGVANAGTMNLTGASSIRLPVGGPAFSNASGSVLNIDSTAGWSFVSSPTSQGGIVSNAGTINVNNGTSWEAAFSNASTATLNIAAGKFVSLQNGQTIAGTVNLGAGSTLWVSEWHGSNASFTGTAINGSGTLQVIAAGPVADFANVNAPSATLLLSNGGTANAVSGTTTFATVNITGGTLGGGGNLNVTGNLTQSAGTQSGTGTTVIASGATGTLGGVSVSRNLTNQGTLDLNGTSLSGLFTNSGTVNVTGSASASGGMQQNAGLLTIPLGQTLGVGGSGLVLAGGTLMGNGTIDGNVNNSAGTVAPGASPGTLTIYGNYTQDTSGVLAVEIASDTLYDQLLVKRSPVTGLGGDVSLAGNLSTTLVEPLYTPSAGQSFSFISADGTISGSFVNVAQPAVLLPPVIAPTTSGGVQLAVNVVSPNVPAPIAPTYNYTVVATEISSTPVESVIVQLPTVETATEPTTTTSVSTTDPTTGTTTTQEERKLVKKPPACS